MRVDLERVRATVGGSGFLHRGSLALLVPTSLLTSLLSRPIDDARSLLGWTVANAVAFLLCWALVEVADRTVFRGRAERPIAVATVLAFGALLGALKGAMTDGFGVVRDLAAPGAGALVWRSLGTAVLGAVAVPALAALHVGVERYRTEHALLVAEQLRGLDLESAGSRSSDLVSLTATLREGLARAAPSTAAATIRSLVDDRLRPVMESLWTEGARPPDRLDARSLVRLAVARNPIPIVGIALVYTLSVLPMSVELTGIAVGTLRSAVAGITLAATLLVARSARRRGQVRGGSSVWGGALHLFATIVLATAVQMLQWDRFLGGMPRASTSGLRITVAVWIAVLVLFGGAVTIAMRERAVLHAELLLAVGPAVLRDVALRDHDRLLAQRVATRLHADVQGRMLAAARRIEREGHEHEVVAQELAALEALLRDLPDTGDHEVDGSLREQLDGLVRRWAGFVDVRVRVSTSAGARTFERPSERERRVVQVVSEGVVNAVRHGLARAAEVHIDQGGECDEVTVIDDGIGPRDGEPGLGSAYFAAASAGAWSLTPGEDGGSVLRVRVTG